MRFGRELRYLSHAEGLIHNEEMLYSADFFARLRTAGLVHMGMITGRFGQEVNSVLERMIAYSGEPWWDVVVCADLYKKPDPQALRFAINAVGTEGGWVVYILGILLMILIWYATTKQASWPANLIFSWSWSRRKMKLCSTSSEARILLYARSKIC